MPTPKICTARFLKVNDTWGWNSGPAPVLSSSETALYFLPGQPPPQSSYLYTLSSWDCRHGQHFVAPLTTIFAFKEVNCGFHLICTYTSAKSLYLLCHLLLVCSVWA